MIPQLSQFLFVSEESPDAEITYEEVGQQLCQIGGWWGVVAERFTVACDSPWHALTELKAALLQDTISYGVVSAVMLTIAQQEMALDETDEAAVSYKSVKQLHVICWYLCFAANMLCLYLSTTEYLYTAATHPKDILLLLSKRYPRNFGTKYQSTYNVWMQHLKVGKIVLFKWGFQSMVPGLLSGVYLRCDWSMTVGPIAITFLTIVFGGAMWKEEMRPRPTPTVEKRRNKFLMAKTARADAEAHLEPCRNSRDLCLAQAPRGEPVYSPLPDHDDVHGPISTFTDYAIMPPVGKSSGSVEPEGVQLSDRRMRHSPSPEQRQTDGLSQDQQVREDSDRQNGKSSGKRSDSGSRKCHSSSDRRFGRGQGHGAPRLHPPPSPASPQRVGPRSTSAKRGTDPASPGKRHIVHFDFD